LRDNQAQNDEEVQELLWQIQYSRTQTRAAGKVAAWVCIGFAAIVILIIPFLAGFRWHQHWDSVGRYVLLLSSFPFILSIYSVGQLAIRWQLMREFQKELKQVLEDRYEVVGKQQAIELGVKE
jgi:hypothetical protein